MTGFPGTIAMTFQQEDFLNYLGLGTLEQRLYTGPLRIKPKELIIVKPVCSLDFYFLAVI